MFHNFKPFLQIQQNPVAHPWARLPLTSFWEHCLSQGLQEAAGSDPREVILKETVQFECVLQIFNNLSPGRQGKTGAVMQSEGRGESPARHLFHHFGKNS